MQRSNDRGCSSMGATCCKPPGKLELQLTERKGGGAEAGTPVVVEDVKGRKSAANGERRARVTFQLDEPSQQNNDASLNSWLCPFVVGGDEADSGGGGVSLQLRHDDEDSSRYPVDHEVFHRVRIALFLPTFLQDRQCQEAVSASRRFLARGRYGKVSRAWLGDREVAVKGISKRAVLKEGLLYQVNHFYCLRLPLAAFLS